MIRLLVADDHEMFREMLRIALSRAGDMEVVGEAGDGRELPNAVQRARPDVLLLDYKMPSVRDFASLLQDIQRLSPHTGTIVLSGFSSVEIAQRAAEGGARGYILKATRLSAVADAVRAVARGGSWIDPTLPRKIFDIFQSRANGPAAGPLANAGLTRREREILACVAEGASNLDIARKLCISEQTVKTHLSRVFAKLNVKNRVGAAMVFYGRTGTVAE
ncbi:MAG: response regulator transcription factor [Deltaproteobacteria bacterium]|nr:response regulator transcription factor [Deltaproteobacteria bacterium]